MRNNIVNLKKIIRKIIVEMQDVPPSRREEKEINKPGVFNLKPPIIFYCMWNGGKNPKIIELLLDNNTDSDLENFATNFEINVRSDVSNVLNNYKMYLSDDLYNKLLKHLKLAFKRVGRKLSEKI